MKLPHLAAPAAAAILASSVPGQAHATPGNLYAANDSSNTIERFTPAGAASVFANTRLNGPQALAFDAAGNLWRKRARSAGGPA